MRCPNCPGHGDLLGALGNLRHYRCRDCGWAFSNQRRAPRRRPVKGPK